MNFLIVIVLCVVSFLFIFPDRFGRKRFENWILSKEPKPYALNYVLLYVLCFGYLGWTGYSVYTPYEAPFSLLPLFLFPYLTLHYLPSLIGKRLEIDKIVLIKRKNPTDYFKNKQQQQKEWIEKSM